MGFWDIVGKAVGGVINFALEEGAQSYERAQKNVGQRMKEHESKLAEYDRKIAQAEKSGKMSNPEFAAKVKAAKKELESKKVKFYTGSDTSGNVKVNTSGKVTIAGYTVDQWDRRWVSLGTLSNLTLDDLRPYNHSVGLYKAEINGKIYYIGRAIEYYNGGFRKRLRDYVRDSDSARTHKSGGKMNENAHRIRISILVVGNTESDVETTKQLEKALIMKYTPEWNVQFNA